MSQHIGINGANQELEVNAGLGRAIIGPNQSPVSSILPNNYGRDNEGRNVRPRLAPRVLADSFNEPTPLMSDHSIGPQRPPVNETQQSDLAIVVRRNRTPEERRDELVQSIRGFLDGHNFVMTDRDGRNVHEDEHRQGEILASLPYQELVSLHEQLWDIQQALNQDGTETFGIESKLEQTVFSHPPGEYDDDEVCCVCQESYACGETISKLECNHYFHHECIKNWLLRKNKCPICNAIGVKLDEN